MCVKWDNPCKTLSTVPSTAVFIKCYHSLIPKDTQTFRDSDLDSTMFCPSFHIPQCFDHLLKKSPFQGFPLQTGYESYLAFSVPVHTLIWKTILSTVTSCLKKISLYERVCPGPGDKRRVCYLFVIADITIINFWFKWHWEWQQRLIFVLE